MRTTHEIIVTLVEVNEFEFLSFITAASNYIIATQNNNQLNSKSK